MSPAIAPASARRGSAVVIGASIAGLIAARALADTFAQVTVYDRDDLPDGAEPRRGVPQGRHTHGVLGPGIVALEELFPGLREEILATGAPVEAGPGYRFYLDGYLLHWKPIAVATIAPSRPLLEHLVRARAGALDGVEIIGSTEVLGLVTGTGRVTGVRIRGRSEHAEESVVPADLVVNAAGRGSRAVAWLAELGYPTPDRQEVRTDSMYVTRYYRREPHHLDGRMGCAIASFPGQLRGGFVLRQEGDRFAVSLTGLLGEDPPTDDAGMLAYADSLSAPEVAEVMRSAEPLGEPAKMRYPASVRHHYEKLDRHLDGFLVIGDALCSFNPFYGQGMTVAAQEGLLLRKLLAEARADLARRFFSAVPTVLDAPWMLSVGGDLRFPEVEGKRPRGAGLVNAYLDRYRAAASVDDVLGTAFVEVANLIAPPGRLFSPTAVLRVLRSAGKGEKYRASVRA